MEHHPTLENIEKEATFLSPREQLQLIERLVHQLKQKTSSVDQSVDWEEFYGLGKGLWAGQDAQDYVNESREDRDASF